MLHIKKLHIENEMTTYSVKMSSSVYQEAPVVS